MGLTSQDQLEKQWIASIAPYVEKLNDLEKQLQAADALAEAVNEHAYLGHHDDDAIVLKEALAAYCRIRGNSAEGPEDGRGKK